jgi:hypothetical protein
VVNPPEPPNSQVELVTMRLAAIQHAADRDNWDEYSQLKRLMYRDVLQYIAEPESYASKSDLVYIAGLALTAEKEIKR